MENIRQSDPAIIGEARALPQYVTKRFYQAWKKQNVFDLPSPKCCQLSKKELFKQIRKQRI